MSAWRFHKCAAFKGCVFRRSQNITPRSDHFAKCSGWCSLVTHYGKSRKRRSAKCVISCDLTIVYYLIRKLCEYCQTVSHMFLYNFSEVISLKHSSGLFCHAFWLWQLVINSIRRGKCVLFLICKIMSDAPCQEKVRQIIQRLVFLLAVLKRYKYVKFTCMICQILHVNGYF